MKVARAKGRLRGKKPKLSPRQEAHLVALHHAGTHTSAELAELFSIARSTVYRRSSAHELPRWPRPDIRSSPCGFGAASGVRAGSIDGSRSVFSSRAGISGERAIVCVIAW